MGQQVHLERVPFLKGFATLQRYKGTFNKKFTVESRKSRELFLHTLMQLRATLFLLEK